MTARTEGSGVEKEILFLCARVGGSEAAVGLEPLLRRVRAWDVLLALAGRHGVASLLYRRLRGLAGELVPPQVMESLRQGYYYTLHRNLFLSGELVRLLGILEDGGIPAAPFKGPHLAEVLYGDLGLRPAGDLDIIVRKKDASRAGQALLSAGYRPEHTLTSAQEKAYMRRYYAYCMTNASNGVAVDVHWETAPSFFPGILADLDLEAALRKSSLGGADIRALSPEDTLIFLCAHGLKHRWGKLVMISDIAALVELSAGLDWERIVATAARLRLRRALSIGLILAVEMLGARVPPSLMDRARGDPPALKLAEEVRRRVDLPDSYGSRRHNIRRALFHLRALDRARDRARYFLLWALAPGLDDWRWISLPGALFPLYVAVRPLRVAVDTGKRLLRSDH